MSLFQRLKQLRGSKQKAVVYECRECGTTLRSPTAEESECPYYGQTEAICYEVYRTSITSLAFNNLFTRYCSSCLRSTTRLESPVRDRPAGQHDTVSDAPHSRSSGCVSIVHATEKCYRVGNDA